MLEIEDIVSDDLGNFEEHWSCILYSALLLLLGFSGVFLIITLESWVWGRKTTEEEGHFLSYHINGTYYKYYPHNLPPTAPVDLDHLDHHL